MLTQYFTDIRGFFIVPDDDLEGVLIRIETLPAMHEFDYKIASFIGEWEETAARSGSRSLRLAMVHHLVTAIYGSLRTKVSGVSYAPPGRDPSGRFRSVASILKHAVYYCLWAMKWLLVFPFDRTRNVVLVSFMPDRRITRAHLAIVRDWATAGEACIVHFSIFYDWASVFATGVYCYPHALFKNRSPHEGTAFESIELDYTVLAGKYFPSVSFPSEARKLWNSYVEISASFVKLLALLSKQNRILFMAQDIDNFAERIIFSLECRNAGIPTLCFNHSIPIYDHLLRTVYSDVAVVWGEQQKERIRLLSPHQPNGIFVSGHPVPPHYQTVRPVSRRRCWLYIMQAYMQPLQNCAARNIPWTLSMLKEIAHCMHTETEGNILLVKAHPSDSFTAFPNGIRLLDDDIRSILPSLDLIFTEDTTLSIELLGTDIPIVYIADQMGEVHIDFERWGAGLHLTTPDSATGVIHAALSSPFPAAARRNMNEYYFGPSASFPGFSEISHAFTDHH